MKTHKTYMVINLSVKISVQPIWQNVFHKKSVGGFTLGINYGSTVSIMYILEKSIFTTTRGDTLGTVWETVSMYLL